jgi:hypothetical protein
LTEPCQDKVGLAPAGIAAVQGFPAAELEAFVGIRELSTGKIDNGLNVGASR